MKKYFTSLFFTLMGFALFAQAPQGINFQGVARDGNSNPIPNTNVDVTFKIHRNGPSGTVIFEEDHDTETDDCGMFRLTIGAEEPNDFENIDWADGPYWLEVEVGGSTIGNLEMLSVPFALYAASSPTPTPEIYIFEEKYSTGASTYPTTPSTGDGKPNPGYMTRRLNTLTAKFPQTANNVSTGGNNGVITFKPGTYVIDASAPAFYVGRHRLFLRDGSGAIKMTGTNELARFPANNTDNTGTDQTRSFIKGILVVPPGPDWTLKFDHHLESVNDANSASQSLGVGTTTPSGGEQVFTTLTVQKIQ
ncbi:MAG: hypothetical protein IPN76_23040 [Saprospiraceae bacterium]|nr:hypothetical protein [Saprospiraceae bacterium]